MIAAISPVLVSMETAGIPYFVGGSVASSLRSIPRTTIDIDMVALIKTEQVNRFAEPLKGSYYIHAPTIHDAILRKSSFNLVHYETGIKIDIFVITDQPFEISSLKRATPTILDPQFPEFQFQVATSEDIILAKLRWYRLGNEVSDRQWCDILTVLKMQKPHLDFEYLQHWAKELNVCDLLVRAIQEADIS